MLAIFLDTETNGLNPFKQTVLEIAFQIIDLSTGEEMAAFSSFCKVTPEEWERSDPESLKINGITWEQSQSGLRKEEIAHQILSLFSSLSLSRKNAVFICQNPSFDRAFFSQIIPPEEQEKRFLPYHWLDLASMYWAKAMELGKRDHDRLPWKTGLSKDRIAASLSLPPENKPHKAMNGVNHLLLCYKTIVGFFNAPAAQNASRSS